MCLTSWKQVLSRQLRVWSLCVRLVGSWLKSERTEVTEGPVAVPPVLERANLMAIKRLPENRVASIHVGTAMNMDIGQVIHNAPNLVLALERNAKLLKVVMWRLPKPTILSLWLGLPVKLLPQTLWNMKSPWFSWTVDRALMKPSRTPNPSVRRWIVPMSPRSPGTKSWLVRWTLRATELAPALHG